MRTLVAARDNLLTKRGGDTVQFEQYIRNLRPQGVEASLTTDPWVSLKGVDVLHVGNIDRILEPLWFVHRALRYGTPVVVSPIFHPPERLRIYDRHARHGMVQRVLHRLLSHEAADHVKAGAYALRSPRLVGPALHQLRGSGTCARRRILDRARAWLLIARGEGKSLRETFQVEPAQEYLIPNGVPESFMVLPRRVSQRRGVLMVGRLEARKNQLSVLRAMRDTDVPVTIVGAANKYHRAYANLVHAELRRSSHSRYVPEVSHDQMRELYASHAVLVNPSWLEVAPLVDLEAAAMGCAVVATTAGYTHEYLGESALYVAPEASSDRIRDVIMQALLEAEPRSAAARARVELFTWARSAELLRQAYERVLGGASLSAPPLADEVALR